jgi:hypothetical protein
VPAHTFHNGKRLGAHGKHSVDSLLTTLQLINAVDLVRHDEALIVQSLEISLELPTVSKTPWMPRLMPKPSGQTAKRGKQSEER